MIVYQYDYTIIIIIFKNLSGKIIICDVAFLKQSKLMALDVEQHLPQTENTENIGSRAARLSKNTVIHSKMCITYLLTIAEVTS